ELLFGDAIEHLVGRRRTAAARVDTVALQGRDAAVREEDLAVVAVEPEEGEEHVLVVSAQEDRVGEPPSELEQELDALPRRRAAVHVAAEEDEASGGAGVDRRQEHLELGGASVDVADAEEPRVAAARGRDPAHCFAPRELMRARRALPPR